MRRTSVWAFVATATLLCAGGAPAAFIPFVPPNDTTGAVSSTNANDGYSGGRGIVFTMTANETINSVGIFQNLTNINVIYQVARVTSVSGGGALTLTAPLRTGFANVTTSGLQFVDFGFANLSLLTGLTYQINFVFAGNSNQNFFYNNANVAWTQGNFSGLDGTQNNNKTNEVVPAIRVNSLNAPPVATGVPLPPTALAAALGVGLLGLWRKARVGPSGGV